MLLSQHYETTSTFQSLALAFASKSAKSYWAALSLAKQGLGEPALILVRSIFEDLVNLAYIEKEPDKLADLYVEFNFMEKHKWLVNIEEFDPKNPDLPNLRARCEPDFLRVKGNYPNKRSWSGKDLKQMAATVDPELKRSYLLLYPYASGFAHGGSALSLASFVRQTDELKLEPLPGPSASELPAVISLAFSSFVRCMRLFASAFKTDSRRLDELSAAGDQLFLGKPPQSR